jgi:hypothetical protein
VSEKRKIKTSRKKMAVIGWREWVALPEIGIEKIKAKVDTGARSSALHAYHVEYFDRDGVKFVRFRVHPIQRRTKETVVAEAPLFEMRKIKSSNGHVSLRPVILTPIRLLDQTWKIELTLTNRESMGFRMLLGRESIRNHMLVDTGRSYYGGGQPARTRKQPKSTDVATEKHE